MHACTGTTVFLGHETGELPAIWDVALKPMDAVSLCPNCPTVLATLQLTAVLVLQVQTREAVLGLAAP